MLIFKRLVILFFLLLSFQVISQAEPTSEESFRLLKELMIKDRDSSYNKNQETFFNTYFEQIEWLKDLNDDPEYVLLSYYNIAYYFRYINLPKESIKNYNLFFDYFEENKSKLTAKEKILIRDTRSKAHSFMADEYSKLKYLDSAKIQHELNVLLAANDSTDIRPSSLNNYGLFYYWNKHEKDTAMVYFKIAYKICKVEFPNHYLIGSIRDNIADVYVENNEFEKAVLLYKENFLFYRQGFVNNIVDVRRLVSAGRQLVETYILLGDLKKAKLYFKELTEVVEDPIYGIKRIPKSTLEYLNTKEIYAKTLNNTPLAYQVSKEIKRLSDSIVTVNNSLKSAQKALISDLVVSRIQKNFELEKRHRVDKIKQQSLRIWILAILFFSFLGFMSSLFLRRRQRIENAKGKQKIAEQNLKLTALENEKLQSEIKSKERDLSDFAINLTQNQEWAKVLSQKFGELKGTKGRERKKLFDHFEQEIENKITFDGDTKEFYQRLDKLSDVFYSQLNSQFPNLTKTEKRLCSLIRLKIDSHEISTLQNITLSSLNTSRYRLRKKLKLSKEADLDAFIQSL